MATHPATRSLGERCCLPPEASHLDPRAAASLAADFRLLADPIRLQILAMLSGRGGEVCQCDLEAALPVKQPTISHHLGLLHRAGLITVVRRGLWAHYALAGHELDRRRERLGRYLSDLTATSKETQDG